LRQFVRKIYSNYGYKEIITPIIEYTELFQRSIGNYTDIVQKEMFTFTDRKGRSISLRPEGTAGVIRAYIENNLAYLAGIKKFFYFGPMFRAERPQKGRYRQFYQFGTEAIGSDSPLLDAEVIKMNLELFKALGINNIQIKINSVGCKNCRNKYTEKLKKFLQQRIESLCDDCKVRSEKNPLRVFDCKNPQCQLQYNKAPVIIDNLCSECSAHFESFKQFLNYMEVKYIIDPKIVRGFDYYTRTVFEITSESLGTQNAILGGGRYDYLVQHLGGKPTPAVGAASGVERLLLLLDEKNKKLKFSEKISIFVATTENVPQQIILKIVELLRKNNIVTFLSYSKRSLKSQLNEANKLNVNYALIIGEDEIKEKSLILRNMKKSFQEQIKVNNITNPIEILTNLLGGGQK